MLATYSPVAALSSYLPIIGQFRPVQQHRLAIGLFVNAAVFVLAAIWVGEPLLKLLGVTTAALTATGGIALIFASVPLMRGVGETAEASADEAGDASAPTNPTGSLRSVLLTPIMFPLTVEGTTFAFGVAASADIGSNRGRLWLSLAALTYAAVTGATLYTSSHLQRRVSPQAARILDRIAGILLANGFTDLVTARLHR